MDPRGTGLERFFALLEESLRGRNLVKVTLGKPCGPDPSLRNVFLRPVELRGVWQLSFTLRHTTRDITKNWPPEEALRLLREWLPAHFLDAHLFTPVQQAQLECDGRGGSRLRVKMASQALPVPSASHDRAKQRAFAADAPWLRELGLSLPNGKVREAMMPKFRQINRFVELMDPLLREAGLAERATPIRIADMGCGKGYLTFALAAHLGTRSEVLGIEARPELVEASNRIAHTANLPHLRFQAGHIAATDPGELDVLIALHACDTATDDALFVGLQKRAAVIVVSPCCQKELRPQLTAPDVLAPALRHGIFAERHAEFATDALRALLLEAAGYQTQVFEFITTEHTAKNLMIAAVRLPPGNDARIAKATAAVQALARFYGVRHQRLAQLLGIAL